MVMTADWRFVLFVGSAVAALATAPASAQTASASLVKPAAIASNAPPKPKTSPAGKWTCVSRATVEIAPVSFDTIGQASAWVVVYRVKGEIVAAERISQREADELRRMPCGTPDSEQGGVLIG